MDGYRDKPSAYADALLRAKTHAQLTQLRDLYSTPQAQATMAPVEHEAFARQYAAESPLAAGVSLPFAIPAYSLAKYLNIPPFDVGRSRPSWQEIYAGYQGLGGGLLQAGKSGLRGLLK